MVLKTLQMTRRFVYIAALATLPLVAQMPLAATAAREATQAGMRPADPFPIGKTVHFTLEKNEEKDFATPLGSTTYYVVWDMQRVEGDSSNIQADADLLKTNGALVQERIISSNEVGRTARVASTFRVVKPFAARVRVKNGGAPMEFWMTMVPVAKKTFLPFGFPDGDLKPLGIGAANGKGGTLEKIGYAYHTIKLPPGKYNVSVYLKQPDKEKTNLQGSLELMDGFGAPASPNWHLDVNEVGLDTRQEKRLVIVKSQTVIFRFTNGSYSRPVEYTIDIEKATD